MTLLNLTRNEDKSAKFDFNVNFPIESPSIKNFRFGVPVGVSHHIFVILVFWTQKSTFFTLLSPQVKIFLFSHWNLIDHV